MEHMVDAAVDPGLLDGQDVERLLHHADSGVIAAAVGADGARVFLRDVVADRAETRTLAQGTQRVGQTQRQVGPAAEQEVGQSSGRLTTNPRQLRKLLDEARHRGRNRWR